MKLVMGASLALLASICAWSVFAAAPARTPPKCFYGRNVNNFVAVNDETVNIRVGVRDVYRLKLFGPCVGVTFVQSIALGSNPSAWICADQPAPADLFIATPSGRQRCLVSAVVPLSPADVSALPKKQRP